VLYYIQCYIIHSVILYTVLYYIQYCSITYSIAVRSRIVVQFDGGRKALRVEDLQILPGSVICVSKFPQLYEQLLDVWAGLIGSVITSATAEYNRGQSKFLLSSY